ncbi:hypothetical protein HDU87_008784 [Geranomyces variabilis]|uniref:Uncharacterized protein n=1 Tax=Geranomyces variabilis TaxID=109894 RepID=A0AAD5TE50_9FUNG|nr:hypothetical protein HDU87_008784 [Geranomyces variabilis]
MHSFLPRTPTSVNALQPRQQATYSLLWGAWSRRRRTLPCSYAREAAATSAPRRLSASAFIPKSPKTAAQPFTSRNTLLLAQFSAALAIDELPAVLRSFHHIESDPRLLEQIPVNQLRKLQRLLDNQPHQRECTPIIARVLRYIYPTGWALEDYQTFLRCTKRKLSSEQALHLAIDISAQGHRMDRKTGRLLLLSLQSGEQPLDLCLQLDHIRGLILNSLDFKPALQLCYENADMDAFSAIVSILERRNLVEVTPKWLIELELKTRAKHHDLKGLLDRLESLKKDGELDPALSRHAIMGHALVGDIEYAELIYRQLDHTTIALPVHEAMITAYLNVERLADARKLFRRCHNRGLRISAHVYAALLQAHADVGDLRSFEDILQIIRDQGIKLDSRGHASIVGGKMKFGDVTAAVSLYREAIGDLKSRYRAGSDVHLALINGYLENGDFDGASQHIEDALSVVKVGDGQPVFDLTLILALVRKSVQQHDLDTAKLVLEWCMKISGKDFCDGLVLAELVEIYIRSGDIGGAIKMLKLLKVLPGSRAHPADLRFAGETRINVGRSRLGSTMRQPPLLTAYAMVITELARLGMRDEALLLVDEAIEGGFGMTYKIVRPLVNLYAAEGDRPASLALVKLMLTEHGAIPTAHVLETVYASYLNLYAVTPPSIARVGEKNHGPAHEPVKQDAREIEAMPADHDAETALRPFRHLTQDLKSIFEIVPSLESMTYEAAVNVHLDMREKDLAELLFMHAQAAHVQPTEQMFQKLAFMYEQGGEHEKAAAVKFEMESVGGPKTRDYTLFGAMAESNTTLPATDWPLDFEPRVMSIDSKDLDPAVPSPM